MFGMDNLPSDLSEVEIVSLDYDMKIKLLERIAQEMLNTQVDFVRISGEFAEAKANMAVLRQVKSSIQTALNAEKSLSVMDTRQKISLTELDDETKKGTKRSGAKVGRRRTTNRRDQ